MTHVERSELRRGLVLHLDPELLELTGACYTCTAEHRVIGKHAFLCIEVSDTDSRWVPLLSRMKKGRQPLSSRGRSGHAWWVQGAFHYHPGQIWTVPFEALQSAATSDMSRDDDRNLIDETYVPVFERV